MRVMLCVQRSDEVALGLQFHDTASFWYTCKVSSLRHVILLSGEWNPCRGSRLASEGENDCLSPVIEIMMMMILMLMMIMLDDGKGASFLSQKRRVVICDVRWVKCDGGRVKSDV